MAHGTGEDSDRPALAQCHTHTVQSLAAVQKPTLIRDDQVLVFDEGSLYCPR